MKSDPSVNSQKQARDAFPLGIALFIVVIVTGCWAVHACAHDPGTIISIQFENDFFGGGTDRHFSHGTRIECLTPPIQVITDAADKLPWFSSERARSGDNRPTSHALQKTLIHSTSQIGARVSMLDRNRKEAALSDRPSTEACS